MALTAAFYWAGEKNAGFRPRGNGWGAEGKAGYGPERALDSAYAGMAGVSGVRCGAAGRHPGRELRPIRDVTRDSIRGH